MFKYLCWQTASPACCPPGLTGRSAVWRVGGACAHVRGCWSLTLQSAARSWSRARSACCPSAVSTWRTKQEMGILCAFTLVWTWHACFLRFGLCFWPFLRCYLTFIAYIICPISVAPFSFLFIFWKMQLLCCCFFTFHSQSLWSIYIYIFI